MNQEPSAETVQRGNFHVPGFRVASAMSGMRYRNRPDCALIMSDVAAAAAGVFTQNRFCAAPVVLCKEHLDAAHGRARAVLINAGIANACTGEEGIRRARQSAQRLATLLGIPYREVLVASTGVIGPQLHLEALDHVLPQLIATLHPEGWLDAARAIMTTDTVPKTAWARTQVAGTTITCGGMAKGSGMISPDMATMLAFVVTDAALAPNVLRYWLTESVNRSFNRITVDGDTSTNDTVLVLASGAAGHAIITDSSSPEAENFGALLTRVCLDLAQQIVRDGEGATKFVAVTVRGAKSRQRALAVARTVANSPLVKTALFGQDANWGRVVAAAGRSGVDFDPDRVSLYFDNVCIFKNGQPVADETLEAKASAVLRQKDICMTLELGEGNASETVYTCDFSYDYVKINADYRS
ncbi:bifunctional glutamate N-acetyltransferase/amino-acid acetyltransferase ArgJ [Desulfosoma caldarium]|uniref:Arginine biosynthesis bifunctional protein ArgJ n=1 Tax=Desulfosoma caldarium TaxID=610254 RepID=A0A3N1UTX1_9BACT|nr:bifunctional glutamate N-acetyltransferase/amino-acid acetyltransferase ArgJ [Desulfosoma caldarium]ROQ92007.1 glutamate N-acetyltransferase [Desulfosoma caldarium]